MTEFDWKKMMGPGKNNPDLFKKYIFDSFVPAGVREAEQQFVQQQYEQQRRDNRADWERQNEYNHPLEQMNRLRQAGLNPNLVYGKGADTTAGSIQSATPGRVDFKPSQLPQQIAGLVQNIRMNKAQTDNIAANTTVALAQRNNLESITAKNLQETAKSEFELQQAKELKEGIIERQKIDNFALRQGIELNLKDYDLRKLQMDINEARLSLDKAKNKQDIEESGQRIAESIKRTSGIALSNAYQKMKNEELFPLEMQKLRTDMRFTEQSISNLENTNKVLAADAYLRSLGIMPGDPTYLRMFMQFVNKGFDRDEWKKDKKSGLVGSGGKW